jgi:hypothetical protein
VRQGAWRVNQIAKSSDKHLPGINDKPANKRFVVAKSGEQGISKSQRTGIARLVFARTLSAAGEIHRVEDANLLSGQRGRG